MPTGKVSKFIETSLIFFILISSFIPGFSDPAFGDATILIYHRFGESEYPTTNVDTDKFKEQMAYLAERQYTVLPLQAVVRALQDGKALPDKSVVITIDDGFRSVYAVAWPILKSYGYPFTVFLYTEAIEKEYRNYMTWTQIREMRDAGVDFQDHGYTHDHFGSMQPGMDEKAYRQWIHSDFATSVRIFEEQLGHRPKVMSYPYGEYNYTIIEEIKKIGYEAAFSQDPGNAGEYTDMFYIPREPILGEDWSTIKHFNMILNRVDLPVEQLEPDIKPLTDATPARFSGRLLYPERYLPNSLSIYVSELGWLKPCLSGNILAVDNATRLQRRINRVLISGKEKDTGKTAVRYWLLISP